MAAVSANQLHLEELWLEVSGRGSAAPKLGPGAERAVLGAGAPPRDGAGRDARGLGDRDARGAVEEFAAALRDLGEGVSQLQRLLEAMFRDVVEGSDASPALAPDDSASDAVGRGPRRGDRGRG